MQQIYSKLDEIYKNHLHMTYTNKITNSSEGHIRTI